MIAKKTVIQDIKLADFPEEIDEQNNIKVYGETSWENQLAVLSHYLHNNDCIESKESKREVIYAIREFLEQKKESKKEEITDEYVTKVAEDPTAYGLFSDFFNVPFPDPKKPKFTFIDLFAGMGGFRLAMQAQGGKCVFSSEWNKYAQKTYLANFGEMPFGDITKEITKSYILGILMCYVPAFRVNHFLLPEYRRKKVSDGKRASRIKHKVRYFLMWQTLSVVTVPKHSFWRM